LLQPISGGRRERQAEKEQEGGEEVFHKRRGKKNDE
jgi:hypothetical protein